MSTIKHDRYWIDADAGGCTQDYCATCERKLRSRHLHIEIDHVDFGLSAYGFCSDSCAADALTTWLRDCVAA